MIIKSIKNKSFFLVILLWFLSEQLTSSVLPESLITTAEGLTQAQNLNPNNTIIGFNLNAQQLGEMFIETPIINMKSSTTDNIIELHTETGVILSPPHQYFFDPVHFKWISAQNLTSQNFLFSDALHALPVVAVKEINAPGTCVCSITIANIILFLSQMVVALYLFTMSRLLLP